MYMATVKAQLSLDYLKQLVICLDLTPNYRSLQECEMQVLLLWSDAAGMLLTSELFFV